MHASFCVFRRWVETAKWEIVSGANEPGVGAPALFTLRQIGGGGQNANRLSQWRKTTYATAKIGKRQIGAHLYHIGLEGYAGRATPWLAATI